MIGIQAPLQCVVARADAPVIWPPNHKFVDVVILPPAQEDGTEVTVAPVYVHQDEPLDALGDGSTSPDARIADGAVEVRAERSGTGDGRIYTVGYRASAADGRSCIGEIQVSVPHSAKKPAVESPGPRVDSLTGVAVDGTEVPTAKLPATLERSASPVTAVVSQDGVVQLSVEVRNAAADDLIGILGDGPSLGSLTKIGAFVCEPWGDGSSCTADVVYTVGAEGHGADSFSLAVVSDGVAWRVPVTVTVAVVNSPPSLAVSPPTIEMVEDGSPVRLRISGWDTETDAADLIFRLVAAPEHGSLTVDGSPLSTDAVLDADAELLFTPNGDFTGADELVLAVSDLGDSSEAPLTTEVTVPITVRAGVDAPVIVPVDTTTREDEPVVFEVAVTDADSAAITGETSARASHGTATVEGVECVAVGDGSECTLTVSYAPDPDFHGEDEFTLAVTDGELETEHTVVVTVQEVNDPPMLESLERDIDYGGTLTVTRAELLGLADAGAGNEQSQLLKFDIVSTDPDITVARGVSQWMVLPAEGVSGNYDLEVTVCDDGTTMGAADPQCASSTLSLSVHPPNGAPTGAPVEASTAEDTSVEVTISATDADGDDLTFEVEGSVGDATVELGEPTCAAASDASECSVTALLTPAANWSGTLEFAVRASDGIDHVSIPVTVTVSAIDDPPSVTAPETMTVDEDSSVDISVVAQDDDSDDAELSIRLAGAPEHGVLRADGTVLAKGDVVNGSAVTLTYAPDANYKGADTISFIAVDGSGGESSVAAVAVTVDEINDAPVLEPMAASIVAGESVALTDAELIAGAAPGPANEASQVLTVDEFTLDEGAPATVTEVDGGYEVAAAATASGAFEATLRVCDDGSSRGVADPQCAEASVTFAVGSASPDLSAPVIIVGSATIAAGGEAVIRVETRDASGPVVVSATVAGEPVEVIGGFLRFTPPAPGHYAVVVTATDAFGLSATASTSITVLGDDDGVAPDIVLDGPDEGATLTGVIAVEGSVNDDTLAHWEVTLTPQGASTASPIVVGEGSDAVANGELGTIDPTTLAGGQYVLQLEAIDDGGRISRIERHVFVDPLGKYGVFSMTFTDAVVQVAGVPLTVQRTYNSASRAQAGEFGHGWSLSIDTLRLERDTPAGESWVRENHGTFLPNYVLVPTASHTVTVVDGASDSMVFDFTPTFINPISDGRYATASWTERSSTGATLEPLDTTELVLTGGYLISMDDAGVYDPDEYRLTMPDGRVFDFDLEDGLTRIEDASGNVVTITDSAIESSTGAAITLGRDGEGRIESVETPSGAETRYEYDAGGNLVGVTDAGGNTTSFAYDGTHLLTGIVDPLGRIPARQEYDGEGRLIAVVDAGGNRTKLASDPDTRTTSITDRLGNTTVQQFNEAGHLVGQVFADGTSESYTVDADGNRLERTDGEGHAWESTYDARDNRTSVTDPLGNTRSFTYDTHNWLTSSTNELEETTSLTYDARGNATRVDFPDSTFAEYTYDAAGNTLTETDESGRTWTYTYDGQGRRLTATSPGGDVTTYSYDDDGRLTGTEAPEGGTTSTTFDARGLATEAENALGGVTSVTFNAAGQRTGAEYPTGVSSSMEYDSLGRVTSSTTAGATTAYGYDLEGRVVRVETPEGVVRETDYDARGRVEEVRENGSVVSAATYDDAGRVATRTDALGETSSFTYDDAGRLTETVRADGTVVSTTYNAAGRALSVTSPSGTVNYAYDARGRVESQESTGQPASSFTYDAAGRVLTSTGGSGTTTFTYDADGRLASATDANGSDASVGYDGDGRRVTVDDANGHSRTWNYDDAGNLLTFEVEGVRQLTQEFDTASRVTARANGDAAPTVYSYDGQGRLQSVDAPDAPAVTYGYDAAGLRTSVTDARGTTDYSYDSRSRLTEIDGPEGSIGYTYDAGSRVATIATDAGTTTYDRGARGRVVGITDPDGGAYALDRDDAGRVESIAFPNGVTEAYTYDAAGLPLTVTVADGASELASFEVTRDDAGRIATFLDSLDGATRSGEFDYDAGGRLTGTEGTAGAESWAATYDLDAVGNRETVTGDGAVDASFNSLDQLVSAGDTSYSYNDSGFLTSVTDVAGTTELSWSAGGELLGSDGPGGAVSYGYDAAGVLVSRTDGTGTVGFVNDASQSLPHAVAGSDGSWWVYAGARPLAQATPDGDAHYLHADVRGDVRVVTDAAGAVTDSFAYSVDGEVTAREGTTPISVGWNGKYSDPDTGLVWLRARWYDPVSARFVSADPWHGDPSVPVSLNRYLYANADPVNNVDPTGLYTLVEQQVSMELQAEINSISTAYYMGLLSTLRSATTVLAATTGVLGAGGAAYWAVTAQAGDPNEGTAARSL